MRRPSSGAVQSVRAVRPSRAWPASLPSYFPFALLACSTTLLACSVTPAPEDAATDAPPEPRDAGMDMGTDTGPVRADPALPTASGACPSFDAPATLSFSPAGIGTRQARIWVGPEAAGMDGPLVFYWHGAGGSPDQAPYVLADALTAITEAGGVVVAPGARSGGGQSAVVPQHRQPRGRSPLGRRDRGVRRSRRRDRRSPHPCDRVQRRSAAYDADDLSPRHPAYCRTDSASMDRTEGSSW